MRFRLTVLIAVTSLAFLACNDLRVDFPESVHTHWWTGFDANGMTSHVLALTEYDGSLVAGGLFLRAGDLDAFGIARWTGDAWAPLARGVRRHDCTTAYCPASAAAFTEWNGSLVVGGRFTVAGGEPAMSIAAWDGSLWHSLGAGFDDDVLAVGSYNGQLVAGGEFTMSGTNPVAHLAIWDGVAWSPLGGGVDGKVRGIIAFGPDLIVAGDFSNAGHQPVAGLARWDGANWTALGSLPLNPPWGDFVSALVVRDGVLFVAGNVPALDADHQELRVSVARWDGQTLWSMGEQNFGNATALCADAQGLVVATGNRLYRWDGVKWSALGSALSAQVFALHSMGGSVFVGGAFDHAGDRTSRYIARWDPAVE